MDVLIQVPFLIVSVIAMIWRLTLFSRHKKQLARMTGHEGLRFEDYGDQARVSGEVSGFSMEVKTEIQYKHSKHPYIQVEGRLPLIGAPRGFCLRAEGLSSGFRRVADQKELEVGDLDFDNAFWVTAECPEALREFLTEERRCALLHWLYRYGSGTIENGVVTISYSQERSQEAVGPTLSILIGLAKAFAGEYTFHQSTRELPTGWVLRGKLKALGIGGALVALVSWFFAYQFEMSAVGTHLDRALIVMGVLSAILAFAGKPAPLLMVGSLTVTTIAVAAAALCLAWVASGYYLSAALVGGLVAAVSVMAAGYFVHLGAMRS